VVEHSTYPVRGSTGATGGRTLNYVTRHGTASFVLTSSHDVE